MRRAALVLLAVVAMAGRAQAGENRLAAGTWGGQHLRLQVEDKGAVSLDFDCATGSIEKAPVLDAKGSFDVEGRLQREHGGPVRKDEETSGVPVRYKGTVQGKVLTLTIVPAQGDPDGPYTLEHGSDGRIFKCR